MATETLRIAILRHVAHSASEDTDNRDGWCRWGYDPENDPWTWDDYRPLVADGLLEKTETWKDVLLRLTPAGWIALGQEPTKEWFAEEVRQGRGLEALRVWDEWKAGGQ